MNSNSFHDLINLDVVHYSFELACRITTMSDKTHATKLNHFIKLFSYSIQNRDNVNVIVKIVKSCKQLNRFIFDVKSSRSDLTEYFEKS